MTTRDTLATMGETIVRVETIADMHKHLRELAMHEALIRLGLAGGADVFGIMPNTKDGLRTAQAAHHYWKHAEWIILQLCENGRIIPFIMITEETTKDDIDECIRLGIRDAKIYPRYRTTQSDYGVVRYLRLLPILQYSGQVGMRVHFHPELPNQVHGNRDAEYLFLPLMEGFLQESDAIFVWEHGTDGRCIPAWKEFAKSGRFWVTLTAHHLLTTEDETFGDVRAACKPPIKTAGDRKALVDLVAEDYDWVMAGSDDAFHPKSAKHVASGKCACGDFTGPFLLPLYAQALEDLLETLEGQDIFTRFTSRNAREKYGLPNGRMVRLVREPLEIPFVIQVDDEVGMPFMAAQTLNWRIMEE